MNLNAGDKLGDWVVVRPLGAGGMGSVYLAHSVLATDVLAALKVLTPGGSADFERRFVQELRTLSALKHSAIVGVQGGGRDDERGLLYMAMELIDGEDLADRLERGPLSIDEADKVFGPVSEALAYAHGRGVAHRDIKPANIMLRKDGTPVIVDFGIAVAQGLTRHTQEGMVPGTMIYLPPEVFEGDTPDPVSTDAYALGVVMWEAVTGQSPFGVDPMSTGGAAMAQIMGQKLRSEALDPGEAAPDALRDVIRRTTEPEPTSRLTDLNQVRDLLTRHPVSSPTMDIPIGRRKKVKKGRAGLVFAVLALLLVVVGAGALLVVGAAAGAGAWFFYQEPAPMARVDRPAVDLAATLKDGVAALEAKNATEARRLAGLAIDDHPQDPNANLLYGQAVLLSEDLAHARPYLCAAVDGGLGDQVPGVKSGDLDCARGPGASTPLTEPLALASVNLDKEVAEDAPAPAPAPRRRRSTRPATAPSTPAAASSTPAVASSTPAASSSGGSGSSSGAPSSRSRAAKSAPPVIVASAPTKPSEPASSGGYGVGAVSAPAPKPAPAPTGTPYATLAGPITVLGELKSSSVVHSIVKRNIGRLKTCYVTGLNYDPAAKGDVDFYINVRTDGSVSGVKFTNSTLDSKAAIGCLMQAPKSWRFPADYGGSTVIKFKVRFERR